MAVRPTVKLTRKQIYDEVWSSAVSGMALKYSIPYSSLLKQIKDANIPVPPSGYWTKKEFNKETVAIPLTGNPDEVIALYRNSATAARMQKNGNQTPTHQESKTEPEIQEPQLEKKIAHTEPLITPANAPPASLGEPEVQESWGGRMHNVYRREVLYKEVWQFPVTEVAKKYSVSDVAIHKICKSLDIPTPPPGYWAKRRAGKEVTIPPLPKSDGQSVRTGLRTPKIYTQATEEQLAHLPPEDQTAVLAVASQIVLVDEHEKMHPKVAACYKKAKSNDVPAILDSVPLPSLEEQKRIADVLAAQDKAIELKERLLAEKQRQKKYLMQQLLTGKKRLPGFDGEWMHVRANQIFRNVTDKKHDGTLEVLSATQDRGIIPRSQVDIDIKYAQAFYGVLSALFDEAQVEDMTADFAAEIAAEITAIIAKHSQVDWTNNQTIHDRISQDIDDLFYDYEKDRGLILDFEVIDKIIENVKTVALRRF